MELNTFVLALVKDIAEQLRPLVADMVKQELAKTDGNEELARAVHKAVENIAANIDLADLAEHISDTQLATIAEHISDTQLVTVGENVNLSDLAGELTDSQLTIIAGELTDSQLSEIAGDIDLSDLAGEFDSEKIYAHIDIDEVMRDFFSNNTFSIRP